MRKTKFTWHEWQYTNTDEDLHKLDKEQLGWFRLIIMGAS